MIRDKLIGPIGYWHSLPEPYSARAMYNYVAPDPDSFAYPRNLSSYFEGANETAQLDHCMKTYNYIINTVRTPVDDFN
jgi:hypothetical protein